MTQEELYAAIGRAIDRECGSMVASTTRRKKLRCKHED